MPMAASGISTKLASRESATSLPFLSGASICATVKLKPTASMLDTTKQSIATGTSLLKSSMVAPQACLGSSRPGTRSTSGYILARFLQKFVRLSVPPNSVVKIVESAITMCPARGSFGGIQMQELNSVLPAAV